MSTRSSDYRKAIDHMPPDAVLVLHDVAWEDYENLLEDLTDRPGVRVTYDHGRLEIVTTSLRHEKYKDFLVRVLHIIGEELGLDIEFSGSTTWKKRREERGTEPDTSFYIANARRVVGKNELDLDKDPPPDLVIEIDVSNQSLSKFPIYAVFGIPEIWRYVAKKKSLVIYELRGDSYAQLEASRSFPILTPDVLAEFLEASATEGQTRALGRFRQWLRQRLS
jgi:Uma2 family endonuclease